MCKGDIHRPRHARNIRVWSKDTADYNLQCGVRVTCIGHEMPDILTCIRTFRITEKSQMSHSLQEWYIWSSSFMMPKKARCLTCYKDGTSDQILSWCHRQITNVNNNRKVLTDLCLPDHTIIGAKGPPTKCHLVVTTLSDVQDMGLQTRSVSLLFAGHSMSEFALMIPLISAVRPVTVHKICQSWGVWSWTSACQSLDQE